MQGISKAFAATQALKNVSLALEGLAIEDVGPIDARIHAGEVVGLAGPRGAGQERVGRALFGLEPVAPVAEPLHMQGWQTIDELNRAFAGKPPSGFVDPVHLFVHADLNSDGGPHNIYDPTNGYEKEYRKIWGT